MSSALLLTIFYQSEMLHIQQFSLIGGPALLRNATWFTRARVYPIFQLKEFYSVAQEAKNHFGKFYRCMPKNRLTLILYLHQRVLEENSGHPNSTRNQSVAIFQPAHNFQMVFPTVQRCKGVLKGQVTTLVFFALRRRMEKPIKVLGCPPLKHRQLDFIHAFYHNGDLPQQKVY